MKYKTNQEDFWAGQFGDKYIERNVGQHLLASNLHFFATALKVVSRINTCMEFGANVGMNLRALALLYPDLSLHALEINKEAANHLSKIIPSENVICNSILNYQSREKFDLVILKGVLIHLNPSYISEVYETIINAANRYILIAEYYSSTPVSTRYRGHHRKLFKRDFAGEILERFQSIHLLDYGFFYKNDINAPQDDINWFLLEKI
jgi:pseudaminic acid biosynthesis-associated methylase